LRGPATESRAIRFGSLSPNVQGRNQGHKKKQAK
jgi:hypothetical protein